MLAGIVMCCVGILLFFGAVWKYYYQAYCEAVYRDATVSLEAVLVCYSELKIAASYQGALLIQNAITAQRKCLRLRFFSMNPHPLLALDLLEIIRRDVEDDDPSPGGGEILSQLGSREGTFIL